MYANSEADQINHFFGVTSLHFCDNIIGIREVLLLSNFIFARLSLKFQVAG